MPEDVSATGTWLAADFTDLDGRELIRSRTLLGPRPLAAVLFLALALPPCLRASVRKAGHGRSAPLPISTHWHGSSAWTYRMPQAGGREMEYRIYVG